MKTLFKIFTSKIFLMLLSVLLQIAVFSLALLYLNDNIPYFYVASGIIAGVYVLYFVSSDINPAYKIAWIIPIVAMPIFGAAAHTLFGKRRLSRKKIKGYKYATEGLGDVMAQDKKVLESLQNNDVFFYNLSRYVYNDSRFTVHALKNAVYFPSGEEFFETLKTELKKAKKYIFLEFFIIDKGQMWEEVYQILKEKAANEVDIRLIYDDAGTILRLPHSFVKELEKQGIKVYLFNPFRPIIDAQLNNRTHRKIVVIDGLCAFTGGINLADEYINVKKPLGHWKDTGVMITGSAVKNFTVMFLQQWALKYGREDYTKYELPRTSANEEYVLPFSDSPLDNKNVYENVYMKLIYNAREYIYINTPYLVLDNEMKTALITAARSGVDVRICVPHKPDKKYVFILTRAFYTELIKEGVKVYEYTPGFIHAKSLVSDGKYSVVGTSNMDFRSFYLHLECGAVFKSVRLAGEMTRDFLDTCLVSREITGEMTKIGVIKRLVRAVLRLFAPLM